MDNGSKREEEVNDLYEILRKEIFRKLKESNRILKHEEILADVNQFDQYKNAIQILCSNLELGQLYQYFVNSRMQTELDEVIDEMVNEMPTKRPSARCIDDYHSHDGGSLSDQREFIQDQLD